MKAYTQIPPGTQILIGRAARRRRVLERVICSVFEGWSYEEIIPPIFDYYDVFIKGMGTGPEEQIYRFIDREGNILALRPEFTSLVAKTVATRLVSSPKPIRLFYSGEVLRFERPRGGRQREFAQIGIEHYGGAGKSADVEILLIAVEKDQAALEALLARLPLGDQRKEELRAIPHLTGGKPVIEEARRLVKNSRSIVALDHLQEIYSIFERLDLAQHLTIDLGEVRGFDYYTGILFRAYVRDLGFEVAAGGRYDGLPGAFGEDLPAVGFSFSLDRLEQIVTPTLNVPDTESVAIHAEQGFDQALQLRRSGKAVKLCL